MKTRIVKNQKLYRVWLTTGKAIDTTANSIESAERSVRQWWPDAPIEGIEETKEMRDREEEI